MNDLIARYFSFSGRVARLGFFVRCLYLNIAAMAILAASFPLFTDDTRLLRWLGEVLAAASLMVLVLGLISVMVRRLHDLGLSGYHVVWVATAEAAWNVLSAGSDAAMLIGLPLFAIDLWLTFWPGNATANRFGDVPD